jgi:hypothetical protein
MTDKIRIVGSFGDSVVEQTQAFVGDLTGVESVQVLRDGTDIFPHPDEEEAAAAHAPADQGGTATPAPEEEPTTTEAASPPFDAATNPDRRVGPEDRREAPAQA